jgi:hypothetical protein
MAGKRHVGFDYGGSAGGEFLGRRDFRTEQVILEPGEAIAGELVEIHTVMRTNEKGEERTLCFLILRDPIHADYFYRI